MLLTKDFEKEKIGVYYTCRPGRRMVFWPPPRDQGPFEVFEQKYSYIIFPYTSNELCEFGTHFVVLLRLADLTLADENIYYLLSTKS